MKKILYITPFYPPDYAGGARLAHSVAVKLPSDFKVIVLTKRFNIDEIKDTTEDMFEGIRVIRTKNYGRKILDKAKSVLNLLMVMIKLKGEYDAIHFIGIPNEVILMTILGYILNKPMVSTMELVGDDDLSTISKSPFGFLKIQVLKLHKKIGALSDELIDISSNVKELKNKIIELPNAIEFDKYSPVTVSQKEELKKKLYNIEPQIFVAIFCGALSKRKGVDLIIKFVDDNLEFIEKNNIKFVFVGPLEDKDLEEKLKFYETKSIFILTGIVGPEDVIKYYQSADMFVFPSRREGFGRVALEARACGIPCFVSNIGPMQQLFKNKIDGILFKSGDEKSFTENFIEFFTNKDLFEKVKKNSRVMFEEKYKIEDLVRRHIDLYNVITI